MKPYSKKEIIFQVIKFTSNLWTEYMNLEKKIMKSIHKKTFKKEKVLKELFFIVKKAAIKAKTWHKDFKITKEEKHEIAKDIFKDFEKWHDVTTVHKNPKRKNKSTKSKKKSKTKKTALTSKLVKSKKFYPPKHLYLGKSQSGSIIGNGLEIVYTIGKIKYKHKFNSKSILIHPAGMHYLVIYDPAGRMTFKAGTGIIG